MAQLETLLANKWIKQCSGPWGSIIVLAPKPHQEDVEDINDFVWRMPAKCHPFHLCVCSPLFFELKVVCKACPSRFTGTLQAQLRLTRSLTSDRTPVTLPFSFYSFYLISVSDRFGHYFPHLRLAQNRWISICKYLNTTARSSPL
jgi:hypothetical protein